MASLLSKGPEPSFLGKIALEEVHLRWLTILTHWYVPIHLPNIFFVYSYLIRMFLHECELVSRGRLPLPRS